MQAKKIAQVSKYFTIWFKKNDLISLSDFREIPTAYALVVAEDIESSRRMDAQYDAEFGEGFSEYLREALLSEIEPEEQVRLASLDKFG